MGWHIQGHGARYVKHVDNDENHPLCRTRLLTALIYLNGSWQKGDGGQEWAETAGRISGASVFRQQTF